MNLGKITHLAVAGCALARVGLSAIFIYAALAKIGFPQDFADALASFHLLPAVIVNPVALSLPPFELGCGLLLLTRHLCSTGLLSVIVLLLVFLASLTWAAVRNLPVNCGCFGPGSVLETSPGMALARDVALLLTALVAYGQELRRRAQSQWP